VNDEFIASHELSWSSLETTSSTNPKELGADTRSATKEWHVSLRFLSLLHFLLYPSFIFAAASIAILPTSIASFSCCYTFFPFSTKSLVSIGVSIARIWMGVDWVGLSHKSWHLVQLSIKGRMMEFLGGVDWSRRLVSTVSGRTFEQTRHMWLVGWDFYGGMGGNMAIKLISKHTRKQQKLNQSKQKQSNLVHSGNAIFDLWIFLFFLFKIIISQTALSWRLSNAIVCYLAAQRVYLY